MNNNRSGLHQYLCSLKEMNQKVIKMVCLGATNTYNIQISL